MLVFYHFALSFGAVLQGMNTLLPPLPMSPGLQSQQCWLAACSQQKRLRGNEWSIMVATVITNEKGG